MRKFFRFLVVFLVSGSANAQSPGRTALADVVAERSRRTRRSPRRSSATTPRGNGRLRSGACPIRWCRPATTRTAGRGPAPGSAPNRPRTSASWSARTCPIPGKRDLRASIASREADAEFQQIEAARLSVVARVKQAYYRLAYAYAVGDVLTRNRDLLDTLLKVSENRYAVGQAAQQDVIKAQTQLSILELQLERVRQERATREGELNALLDAAGGDADRRTGRPATDGVRRIARRADCARRTSTRRCCAATRS